MHVSIPPPGSAAADSVGTSSPDDSIGEGIAGLDDGIEIGTIFIGTIRPKQN